MSLQIMHRICSQIRDDWQVPQVTNHSQPFMPLLDLAPSFLEYFLTPLTTIPIAYWVSFDTRKISLFPVCTKPFLGPFKQLVQYHLFMRSSICVRSMAISCLLSKVCQFSVATGLRSCWSTAVVWLTCYFTTTCSPAPQYRARNKYYKKNMSAT